MKIDLSQPDFDQYLIYLNGWIQKAAVAADDTEGWVEVIDVRAMTVLDFSPQEASEPHTKTFDSAEPLPLQSVDFTEAPIAPLETKLLYGEVQIIKAT